MSYSDLSSYIKDVYRYLSSEEVFSRAKEYSWQTFFHHCTSVALISYRLGVIIKSNAPSMARMAIEAMENKLGIEYEKLLFLTGIAHDYVKLYGIEGETGRERVEKILRKLIENMTISDAKDAEETIVSKVLSLASAVEGVSVPELEEEHVVYIAPVVRIADNLMGVSSLDEAVAYLQKSSDVSELVKKYSIKFGYVKVSAPSILHVKTSEKVVEILIENGWTPLAVYFNGVLLVGSRDAISVPMREIYRVVETEVMKVFEPEKHIKELAQHLEEKSISKLYSLLEQTNAGEVLISNLDQVEGEAVEPIHVYHDLIVEYLKGSPVLELYSKLAKAKSSLGKRGGTLIDPRRLATGVGKGSTYFNEKLSSMIVSKDTLTNIILSLDKKNKFLLLSYMVAFPSKEEGMSASILKKALGITLPSKLDPELLRVIAIAEVYRHLNNDEVVRKLVEAVYDELKVSQDISYYVSRFIATTLKSDIIYTEPQNSIEKLLEGVTKAVNYCRICNEPLLSNSIRYIEYARVIGKGGGASEIWLHDDPPLADLEKIATDKETSIRYICPLCYYEAEQLQGKYSPPFLVVALHPVVSYDLWLYIKSTLATLQHLYDHINRDPYEVARIYENAINEGMKVTPDVLFQLTEKSPTYGVNLLTLFDHLGAKVILPLGTDMSLKKRDVALALAIAPFVMSASGGGQVALESNLTGVYNMGSEITPLIMPHPTPIILSIVEHFEKVKLRAKSQERRMTLSEYAVYNMSYISLLETLFIYGLKLFSWFAKWRNKNRQSKINDYALELLEYISLTPYVPLALDAPPPERLNPRQGDEPLPYYSLISLKSLEVETRMSQVNKVLEGKELPSINKAVYIYAKSLKELSEKKERELSRHAVQKPLRRAIEIIIEFTPTIGGEEARKLAREKFIDILETSLGVDLSNIRKRVKGKKGEEEEVTYRQMFLKVFDDISEVLLHLMNRLPPNKLSKLIEVLLDSAYEKYKSMR